MPHPRPKSYYYTYNHHTSVFNKHVNHGPAHSVPISSRCPNQVALLHALTTIDIELHGTSTILSLPLDPIDGSWPYIEMDQRSGHSFDNPQAIIRTPRVLES